MLEYKSTAVVIAAGGSADRFGGNIPKQFLDLGGEPVVIRALKPFLKEPELKTVAVAVHRDWMDWMKEQLCRRGWDKKVKVVPGGAHRGESVFNGLKAIKDTDIVHIHDAARPFVNLRMITEAAKRAWEYGGAAVAIPVKDTIKKENEGIIAATFSRDNLWRVQTPQSFRTKVILKAYKIAMKLGFQGTDDCVLLEKLTGIKVRLIQGSELNIKITTPEDFLLAQAITRMLDEIEEKSTDVSHP